MAFAPFGTGELEAFLAVDVEQALLVHLMPLAVLSDVTWDLLGFRFQANEGTKFDAKAVSDWTVLRQALSS